MKYYPDSSSRTILSCALLVIGGLFACLIAPTTTATFTLSSASSLSANAGPDITVYAGEPVRLDGSASTGYTRESLPADGTWSMRWTTGDGYDVENILKAPHVYMQPGVYTAELTLKDATGAVSTDSVTVNVLPISAQAADVQTLTDSGSAETNRLNLQAALERAAQNPRSNEIVLPAGFTANDPIILPARAKSLGSYVTVRVADLTNLPPLRRVTSADRAKLFKINARPAGVSGYNQAILIRTNSNYFRFVGLEINRTGDPGTYKNDIVAVETDSTETRPSNLIFDRVLIDVRNNNTVRAFAPNSEVTSLLNSSILNVNYIGYETKAIGQWSGNGPLGIVNNRLEAAAINFLVGGAPVNYPSEILDGLVFRGNHSWKDPSLVTADFQGKGYGVKNLWELKAGHNVVTAGNVFENNWADGQSGEAILIKSAAQGSESNPYAEVRNVDFRNNKILNTRAGFSVIGIQSWIAPHPPYANHIRFVNNLWQERSGRGNLILTPDYFELNHNTFVRTGNKGTVFYIERANPAGEPETYRAPGLKILNNLTYVAEYGTIFSSYGHGTQALDYGFTSWELKNNVVMMSYYRDRYPNSYFPNAYEPLFVDYAGGNYSLLSGSIYRTMATDGREVGADMTVLNAQANSAVGGLWSVTAGGNPTPAPTFVYVGGRVTDAEGTAVRRATVSITGPNGTQTAYSNSFGYFVFDRVAVGNYTVTVSHKRYEFTNPTRQVTVSENVVNLDFVAAPESIPILLETDQSKADSQGIVSTVQTSSASISVPNVDTSRRRTFRRTPRTRR